MSEKVDQFKETPPVNRLEEMMKDYKHSENNALFSKPTNPKDSVGIGKFYLSTVPLPPLGEIGLAMLEGARKYGRHNYRDAGVLASVYFDAAIRHLFAWWEGEDIDPDSGLPHIIKAATCLIVLRDAQIHGAFRDDRPPCDRVNSDWTGMLNALAKVIIDKYTDAKEPYTNINKQKKGNRHD